jgi:enoyl-CoA hydratase/carnithine racemase
MSERTETRSEEPTDVTLAREGGVATVTLNRPERRNALSDDLLVRLAALCADVREDERVRVVVLTGAPPVFSAGADAGLRASMSLVEQREAFLSTRTNFLPLFCRVLEALEALPQPTIASINGHAVGGGWALTLACDFRFAAADVRLWIPEVDLGIPLATEMTARFVRFAGPARTKRRSSWRAGATRRPKPATWGWSIAWCRRRRSRAPSASTRRCWPTSPPPRSPRPRRVSIGSRQLRCPHRRAKLRTR